MSVFSLFRFVAGGFLVGGCFRIRLQVSVVRVLFVLLGLGYGSLAFDSWRGVSGLLLGFGVVDFGWFVVGGLFVGFEVALFWVVL